MKIAFVNSNFSEDIPKKTRNLVMAEALQKNNVKSIFYTPVRKSGSTSSRLEGENGISTIFVSCWVPIFSKCKDILKRRSILFRRIFDMMELLVYIIRVRSRLRQDRVDAYVILHLWDSTIALLNPILSHARPTALLWMGYSLRWLSQFKLIYSFSLPIYKHVLRKATILTILDVEQEMCLFKILKLPNVYKFNPCIVDETLFRELDKNYCMKSVGFDRSKINVVSMCRLLDSNKIECHNASDYAKDIFSAIELLRILVKHIPNLHFHVVGSGDGIEYLKSKIACCGLEDNVTVHGWIESDQRPLFVNAADIVFNPYPLIELNDATAIFEAFQCARPVLAFKRYTWVPLEHKGGFLVSRNPHLGAEQLVSRLNLEYLAKKGVEAKTLPQEHNVSLTLWGKKLSEILYKMLKKQVI